MTGVLGADGDVRRWPGFYGLLGMLRRVEKGREEKRREEKQRFRERSLCFMNRFFLFSSLLFPSLLFLTSQAVHKIPVIS